MSGLVFPVIGATRISSLPGARSSPGGIGSTNHAGIDIAAPLGSPVVAPTDLKILSAGSAGGFGNLVTAQDSEGYIYKFGHLSEIAVGTNDYITAGGQLGAVGSTGNSTGNHLHYEVRDAAGKVAIGKAKEILGSATTKLKGALKDAAVKAGLAAAESIVPGSGQVLAAVGVGQECDMFCRFKKWVTESNFFQRAALIILAILLIVAAFYLFGSAKTQKLITTKLKGLTA